MPDELVACGDLSPWDLRFRWARALATEVVFLLALHLIELDYIDQPTMSGRRFKASREFWVFTVEPLGDGLVRVAPAESADNLPVVAIAPDCL